MKRNSILIVIAVLLFATGFICGYKVRKHSDTPVITGIQSDTTVTSTEVRVPVPDPATSTPSAPVRVGMNEVSITRDSASVDIPGEMKTYRDTLPEGISYTATVSGVRPKLEDLTIQYPSSVITRTVTVSKPYEGWILSATSNNALTNASGWQLSSQTSLELSYNTGPFHLGLQGGVLINKPFTSEGPGIAPYLGGRLTIDIARFR